MNSQLILCATVALLCGLGYAARYFYRRDSTSSRMHRSLRNYVRQASTPAPELS